ncbi:hypothetical protein ACUIJQ_08125 [Levilactobacillus hammesii]|nr:hypothetical protein [Levilactobacillus hammesii]
MNFVLEKDFYEPKDIVRFTDWISQATNSEIGLYVEDSVFYSSISFSSSEPGKYHKKHRYTLILTAVARNEKNKVLAEKYISKREKWYRNRVDSFLIIPSVSTEMDNSSKLSNTDIEKIKSRIHEYLKVNEVADIDKFDVDMIEHANIEAEISHLGYNSQNEMELTLRMGYVTM